MKRKEKKKKKRKEKNERNNNEFLEALLFIQGESGQISSYHKLTSDKTKVNEERTAENRP